MYLYIYIIYIFNVVLFRQQRMSENIALCFEFKYYALFIGFGFIFVCLIDKKTRLYIPFKERNIDISFSPGTSTNGSKASKIPLQKRKKLKPQTPSK